MATKIFINLPVKDLDRSKAFFSGLGYSFNPQFTDDKAACMVVNEHIYIMMLVENYFKTFTKKEVGNAHLATEVLLALDAASREEVQQTIAKATELGGSIYAEPQDYGWMYQHSFADPDGHQWEIVYMDATNMPNCG
ncbi:extradiol dioxygenase [Niastella vici]|uniref:Extradiol dioxygenase n=1 Tax=Niastella vici TaxID=1703345 RepID=A0A1V9FHM0_9BACT|nr:VOC family protein [Niastella vici]OQP57706.1 extradiol dioxygenase [Niastella vici]